MRRILSVVAVMLFVSTRVTTQEPSCKMCPATYISNEELQEYVKRAAAGRIVDQQVRALDVGKINAGIGLVHRTRLEKAAPASVAEHDLVGEIYHVISGSATFVTGPDLVDKRRRPADNQAVRMLNGPGNNAASIRGGATHQLKAGDVIVIPAGTGHWFTKIDDHITYLMIRLDPDKVVPLMDESASKAYLKSPLPAGRGRSGGP
jgi:mannose-6-phosphate isomerase-like protein (cupin superfamily)